jgi:tetratricopeptide (TPR) repeat protein
VAQIGLRDYLNGIDEMIDAGQIEEALAHCRHILSELPKHVDTYRLLGKAYLEAKRHGEASDIFQRVLSSVPDDFVAHIGMSIIREDEGNTDAAIWHMERAFEAQPSNRAVQDELRRLYGEREGFQPPKVRLTRGALARMYAHGDLYAQAISELRGALSDDGNRPDLQVLLARMYFLTNRHNEATEICNQVLEKLPYCLYANHLMADILGNQDPAAAEVYLNRVRELDPYAAQTSTLEPAESIPGNTVMVERLVTEGASRVSAASGSWTGALDPAEAPENYEPEQLPDWLSAGEEELPTPEEQPAKKDTASLEALADLAPEDEVPGDSIDPNIFDTQGDDYEEQDIPDWLRELRPEEQAAEREAGEAEGQPRPQGPNWQQEFKTAGLDQNTPLPGTEDLSPRFSDEEDDVAEGDDEDLKWLEGLAAKQGADEEELLSEPDERDEDKPDWLKTPEERAAESANSLAWLDEMAAETEEMRTAVEDEGQDGPAQQDTGNLFASEISEEDDMDLEEETPAGKSSAFVDAAPDDEDSTPAWLRELSAAAEVAPKPGDPGTSSLEDAPDWLDELRPSDTDDLGDGELDSGAWEAEPEGDRSNLDWLDELGPAKGGTGELKDLSDWEQSAEEDAQDGPPSEIEQAAAPTQPESTWIPERDLDALDEAEEAADELIRLRDTASLEAEPEAQPAAEQEPAPEPEISKPNETVQLVEARASLADHRLDDALGQYGKLVRGRKLLDEVVSDLENATSDHPRSVELLQLLGDAYMRSDRLREALDFYTKAEELL